MYLLVKTIALYSSFSHLEANAKRVAAGDDLQKWGRNLLREYPSPQLCIDASRLGTNFPQQLLQLYHVPPTVVTYEPITNEQGLVVRPGFCKIIWGGGVIGHCGLVIGETNFPNLMGWHEWQPGVYFWSEK